MSNQQLNKLKSGIEDGTEVALKLSSNEIDNANDDTSFPHKLLLANTQVLRLHKGYANNLLADTKLSNV